MDFGSSYTPDEEHTMIFDADTRLLTNHDHELLPLLQEKMQALFEEKMEQSRDKIQH